MNVTIRQLRAFALVVQLKSFTKAAAQLHLTQSALSLLIRQLEENLEVQLIERSTRRLEPTALGLELMASAERLLDDFDAAIANVAELGAKQRGKVTITAPYILATAFLAPVVGAFKARHPGISVVLRDSLPEEVVAQVRNGAADLAVASYQGPEAGLRCTPIFEEPLVAVYPKAHALNELPRVCWRDLVDLPVILLSRQSLLRHLADEGFVRAGFAIKPAYELAYAGTAIALVKAGCGVAILPRSVEVLVDAAVSFSEIEGPEIRRDVAVITRDGKTFSPAAEIFIEALLDHAKAMTFPTPVRHPSKRSTPGTGAPQFRRR
ncbi:LysR family transcriptional regulator [Bosea sp. BK604]|uniref:LysR family transcriptional regulator n=1 Tax=Bosea sp. BK604 TaxID=2512180 RepID=UPI001043791B|nr:LysR family transcriptional regulator [Bosea sp. BK604]TCR63691.1 DNA-binding transcriptional LysR family regulator [Bosea sp. BK604]